MGRVYLMAFNLICFSLILVKGQNWYEYEGRCYWVSRDSNTFDNARNMCKTLAASFVELNTTEKLRFVQTVTENTPYNYWVGLMYNTADSKFYWIQDGTEPMSTFWMPGEPNFTGYCVRLTTEAMVYTSKTNASNEFLLADHPCTQIYNVICEKTADLTLPIHFKKTRTSSKFRCPLGTSRTESKLDCGRSCSRNILCNAFEFNEVTGSCVTYEFAIQCATRLAAATMTLYTKYTPRC